MSGNIRTAIYRKIVNYLGNANDTNDAIFRLNLKQDKSSGIYSFLLPLKTKEFQLEGKVESILKNDGSNVISDVTLKEGQIYFNISRDKFIKEILESYHLEVAAPKYCENDKNVIVEFSSPNIAKPFHVGHLRSTIVGNYIANINSFFMNNVKKLNYLGDWGTQFGFLQLGVNMGCIDDMQMKNDPIKSLYAAYVTANKLAESDHTIANQAKEIFKRLENEENAVHQEWNSYRNYTIKELERIYKRINVTFDEYHWESMYNAKNIRELLSSMEETHLLVPDKEGRKVVRLNSEKIVPIIKSDGTTLYITRDIAAAIDRYNTNKFDVMYYVVDNTQTQHFKKLVEILEKMEMNWSERLKHVGFGRILGMSTRKGTSIFFDDILNETRDVAREKQIKSPTTKASLDSNDNSTDILGISALIINDLKQKRKRDYTFDWNAAFDVKGDTGIKLQYTHCRLLSLEENSGANLPSECDPTLLKEAVVDELINVIGRFEETVLKSYQQLEPCVLVTYLFQLSNATNKALKNLQVKNLPVDVGNQRLLLFHVAKNVLAKGMRLLGLIPLDKM